MLLRKGFNTVTFKLHQSRIKTIRQDDPGFKLKDGFAVYPRAGLHILQECPSEYRMIINECLSNGWLKPVAYVYDYEQTMDLLKESEL